MTICLTPYSTFIRLFAKPLSLLKYSLAIVPPLTFITMVLVFLVQIAATLATYLLDETSYSTTLASSINVVSNVLSFLFAFQEIISKYGCAEY